MREIITCVIPVTNSAGRLDNLNRTFSEIKKKNLNIQIIVVHDYSEELTSIELNSLHSHYKNSLNMILLEGNFGSPGLARNYGKNLAGTKWITFWDADDLPSVNSLEILMPLLSEANCDAIIGHFNLINKKTNKTYIEKKFNKNLVNSILQNPGIWRFIFRNEFIESLNFTNLRMGEDQEFIMKFLLKKPTIDLIDMNLYTYFQGDSMQATADKSRLEDLISLLDYLKSDLINVQVEESKIIMQFYIQNIFTILYRGSIAIKRKAISNLIELISNLKWKERLNLIAYSSKIIKLKVMG